MLNSSPISFKKLTSFAVMISLCFTSVGSLALDNNAKKAALSVAATENQEAINQDAQIVLTHILASHELRDKIPGFVQEATKAMDTHKGALPAAYSLRIMENLNDAEEHRDILFKQAIKHRSALYRTDKAADSRDRIQEVIIGLAAAVTLYENNKVVKDNFADNPLLRKKMDETYPELGVNSHYYSSSMARATDSTYIKNFTDASEFFSTNKSIIATQVAHSSPEIQQLYKIIAESPVLGKVAGNNMFKELLMVPVKVVGTGVDITGLGLKEVKFRGSQVVGNTMGMVKWRSGKLKDDAVIYNQLQAHLQPGDILLEKTPFALTDKTIPGHFGHAAVYTGSYEQLQQLKAFDAFPAACPHVLVAG